MSESHRRSRLLAAIFDVDGVLVASPHERAWREALAGYAGPCPVHDGVLPGACCRQAAAGRRAGDAGGLGVPDAAARTPEYARKKQALMTG
jgi:beta-phosphoglucomutase